jgi:hypothetical protein
MTTTGTVTPAAIAVVLDFECDVEDGEESADAELVLEGVPMLKPVVAFAVLFVLKIVPKLYFDVMVGVRPETIVKVDDTFP